jgi:hypothetical protein
LNRTFGTATNQKIWTWSGWVKKSGFATNQPLLVGYSATTDTGYANLGFYQDTLQLGLWTNLALNTPQVFRDPSAWYHIVVATDLTQATATNRIKVYVNGSQVAYTQGAVFPAQNGTIAINSSVAHNIASRSAYASDQFFDGYLTEINFIDGQQLTASSFGSTNAITGVWQPAKYTGTYGTNGFYLNFSDNSNNTATTIGKDYSGNGNNWTPNNISVTAGVTYDSMTDVPTLTSATAANYAVLNPVNLGDNNTLSNANLTGTISTTSGRPIYGSIAVTTGKWYWETLYTASTSDSLYIGVNGASLGQNINAYSTSPNIIYGGGTVVRNGSTIVSSLATITVNDIVGVALDADAGTIAFYKNNTLLSSQNLPTGDGFGWRPLWLNGTSGGNQSYAVTFGQRPFSYTPPTGYVALNTYNLPASTITNGAAYMNAVARSGFGASGGSVTSLAFQPDLIWEKTRNLTGDHFLVDSVRTVSKTLSANTTAAEATNATYFTSFNSNGYSLGSGDWSSSYTLVDWCWKAGTTSASNTNGSITSTVSVGATQGFSVVTWTGTGATGATIGHGLGVAPSMVIVKQRTDNTTYWNSYHVSVGNGSAVDLNTTSAATASVYYWNNTSPTSSVFTVSTNGSGYTNVNAKNYVAYCFAAVAGYSAFGSFVANGSADGPFVYLGFRPRFVLVKDATAAGGYWEIHDTSRSTYNATTARLWPNVSSAEATGADIDFLSNGFKVRTTDGTVNNSGSTVIYMAFAENPFRNSLAR